MNKKNTKKLLSILGTGLLATNTVGYVLTTNHITTAKALDENSSIEDFRKEINNSKLFDITDKNYSEDNIKQLQTSIDSSKLQPQEKTQLFNEIDDKIIEITKKNLTNDISAENLKKIKSLQFVVKDSTKSKTNNSYATNFVSTELKEKIKTQINKLSEKNQEETTNIKDNIKNFIWNVRDKKELNTLLDNKIESIQKSKQEKLTSKDKEDTKKPMSKEEVEQLKQQCTSNVSAAENSKDINDISKARDLVNKLPEGKEKQELQDKLDKIQIKGFDESTKSNVTGDMDVVVESNPTIEMTLSTNLLNIKDYNGLEDIEIPNAFSITVSSGLSFDLNVQALDNLKNDKGNIIPIDHMTLKAHEGKEITVSKDKKETLVTNHKHGKDIKFDFDVKLKADSSIEPDIYKTTLKFEASQK